MQSTCVQQPHTHSLTHTHTLTHAHTVYIICLTGAEHERTGAKVRRTGVRAPPTLPAHEQWCYFGQYPGSARDMSIGASQIATFFVFFLHVYNLHM